MFEFYFPHIMESTSDGSWWPTIIGSLLGALFSGLVAIWIFRRGLESEKRKEETHLRRQLTFFVELFEELVKDKYNTVTFNQKLIENYRNEPLGTHAHKLEVVSEVKLLNDIVPREIREGLDLQLEGKDAVEVFRKLYQTLAYFQKHSEVYLETVLAMKRDWFQLGLEFSRLAEDIRAEVAEFPIQFKDQIVENALAKRLDDLLINYVANLTEAKQSDIGYHYENFIKPIVQTANAHWISTYPDFAVIARSSKQAELLVNAMKNKSMELANNVEVLDSDLATTIDFIVQLIQKHLDSKFIVSKE